MTGLINFIAESNRIEGITGAVSAGELDAHKTFLGLAAVTIRDLEVFVLDVARADLRAYPGMNVRVGNHLPPPGGPAIKTALQDLLDDAQRGLDPYTTHHRYETLHPFMDGNGRSGRVLWLWQMLAQRNDGQALRRGFLHSWYYQSLSAGRP